METLQEKSQQHYPIRRRLMTLRLVSAMIPASVLLLLRHWNVQPLRETNATFRLTAASAVRFARTKHCFESGSEESLSRTTSPGLGGLTKENLTPLDVVKYTTAYAQLLKGKNRNSLKVITGRDARISGPMIHSLVNQTLVGMGVNVINLELFNFNLLL